MADSIFDGCIAAKVGIKCNCRYCSFIKNDQGDVFPAGFPEWMKDYRAVQVIRNQQNLSTVQQSSATTIDSQISINTNDIAVLKSQVSGNINDVNTLKSQVNSILNTISDSKFDPKKLK